MLPPEVQALPDRRSHIRRQREQLGPLSRGEKNVLSALTVMLVLWMLPTFVPVEFLDIWYAPPVAMVLLFLLPVDAKRGEMTLDRKDFQEGVAWNVLFLVVGGLALVGGLTRVGVTDWIGAAVTGSVAATALPWMAGMLTTVLTQLASGTATTIMVSSMLFPIAEALDYNAAVSRPDHRRRGPFPGAALVRPDGGGGRSPQALSVSGRCSERAWWPRP